MSNYLVKNIPLPHNFKPKPLIYDKKQKISNLPPSSLLKTKWIVVLFLALQLAACRKQTFVEPEVSKTKQKIIDLKALKAVRAWYAQEQEAFKTLRKASRSIGIDSLPFLPQWEQVQTFVLSDSSKLLVSPVIRYALVSYNMQIGFVRKMAVHLDAKDHIKEARILEFVGERNYIANYQDSLALWYIEKKPWQGFVLNLDITHQFIANQQLSTMSVGVECSKDGMITGINYVETLQEGICIESTTYFYGFDALGRPITCTDSESTICPISVTAPGNGGGGAGSTGGNPGGNPVSFPVTGGIAVGSNPWSGWGLGSDYGGGIGGIPIYVHDPSNGQYPIDPGNNIDPKNGGWFPPTSLSGIFIDESLNEPDFERVRDVVERMLDNNSVFNDLVKDYKNPAPGSKPKTLIIKKENFSTLPIYTGKNTFMTAAHIVQNSQGQMELSFNTQINWTAVPVARMANTILHEGFHAKKAAVIIESHPNGIAHDIFYFMQLEPSPDPLLKQYLSIYPNLDVADHNLMADHHRPTIVLGVMEFMSENCGVNVPSTDQPKYEALAWLGLENHSLVWKAMTQAQQKLVTDKIKTLIDTLPQNTN